MIHDIATSSLVGLDSSPVSEKMRENILTVAKPWNKRIMGRLHGSQFFKIKNTI